MKLAAIITSIALGMIPEQKEEPLAGIYVRNVDYKNPWEIEPVTKKEPRYRNNRIHTLKCGQKFIPAFRFPSGTITKVTKAIGKDTDIDYLLHETPIKPNTYIRPFDEHGVYFEDSPITFILRGYESQLKDGETVMRQVIETKLEVRCKND